MATPQFILDLRTRIGHDPLWLMGVTACIINSKHELLLAKRADTNQWALIYGIIEPGEEAADCAVRETLEETCVPCTIDALVALTSSPRMITYVNGDQAQYMDHMFIGHATDEQAALARVGDGENTAVGWFAQEALPDNLAQSTRERLQLLDQWRAQGSTSAIFGMNIAQASSTVTQASS